MRTVLYIKHAYRRSEIVQSHFSVHTRRSTVSDSTFASVWSTAMSAYTQHTVAILTYAAWIPSAAIALRHVSLRLHTFSPSASASTPEWR